MLLSSDLKLRDAFFGENDLSSLNSDLIYYPAFILCGLTNYGGCITYPFFKLFSEFEWFGKLFKFLNFLGKLDLYTAPL